MQFKKIRIRKATGKKKSQGGQNALNKLNSFLNAASAEPAYILHSTWANQQNAITYKEIREAIMNGHMSESTFQQWQQDYSKMVIGLSFIVVQSSNTLCSIILFKMICKKL